MSQLKPIEKERLKALFGMNSGYVLEFSNRTFANFFAETLNVDIYAAKYEKLGTSKANRLRAFWEIEDDAVVGRVISDLLDYWSFQHPEPTAAEQTQLEQARAIASRLLGFSPSPKDAENEFIERDLGQITFARALPDHSFLPVLEARFDEAQKCLKCDAPLAVIFHCGSILKGLLLGTASAPTAVQPILS